MPCVGTGDGRGAEPEDAADMAVYVNGRRKMSGDSNNKGHTGYDRLLLHNGCCCKHEYRYLCYDLYQHTLHASAQPPRISTPSKHRHTFQALAHPPNISTPCKHHHTFQASAHPSSISTPAKNQHTRQESAYTPSAHAARMSAPSKHHRIL